MQFDPALAARDAFLQAELSAELREDWSFAREAEDTFSGNAGPEAKAAYQILQSLGERHPNAMAFQQFLIYITWQQVVEDTSEAYFARGLALCDRYLDRWAHSGGAHVVQITELRDSFRAGLGLDSSEPDEYERDTVKGGD